MPRVIFHRKKSEDSAIEAPAQVEAEYIPDLRFIGTEEIVKELTVGTVVDIIVTGKVVGLSADDYGGDEPPEFAFRVEPASLDVYPENEFTKLDREAD